MEISNIALSKDSFVHTIISSELNFRYIQPSYPLSDNIISHSVPFSVIESLKSYYQGRYLNGFTSYLKTSYFDLNKIYTVKENRSHTNTIRDYRVVYRNDYKILDHLNLNLTLNSFTLEYAGENHFLLNTETFQIKKSYDHERQSFIEVMDNHHFTLEIEGLLLGISTYAERQKKLNLNLNDDKFKFESYSFKFIVKQGMPREELQDHVSFLSLNLNLN